MRIAVLGTGHAGRTVSGKLAELGHQVAIGTRDITATMARIDGDGASYRGWASANPTVQTCTFAHAAANSELVVNASSGEASMAVLRASGADHLANKPLLDLANPLDFSQGTPPALFVKDTDSLAEQIQRAFPRAKVVKALNTMTAALMVNPAQLAAGDHTTFICGDDSGAKEVVSGLLGELGHRDIVDLGDITGARAMEMLLPAWLRLWDTLGTPIFNFKIVR